MGVVKFLLLFLLSVVCCSASAQPNNPKDVNSQQAITYSVTTPTKIANPVLEFHAYHPGNDNRKKVYENVTDTSSFSSDKAFKQQWNYYYPWGTDHNGSARMYKKQLTLKDNVLQLKAVRVKKNEGKSKLDPYLDIKYQSGAVHAKHKITVTKQYPEYEISGEFKAPVAPGTWPAFWITAVNG